MRVIAFYTRGTPYEREAERLARSLRRAGTTYQLSGVDLRGDWLDATAYKPLLLSRVRREQRGTLLYVDVDAVVHQNCEADLERIAESCDIGVHYFQGPAGGYNRNRNDNRMLSGTILLADTERCQRVLDAWHEMTQALRENGIRDGAGQKHLWYLTTCMPDLRIAKLPGRYCYVFDKPWAYPPDEPRIIEHTIASRENRGRSKGRVHQGRQQRIREIDEALA